MARRSHAYRMYLARRSGLFNRLRREARIPDNRAERWIAQWELEGALRGLDKHTETFWTPAWEWIAEKLRQ